MAPVYRQEGYDIGDAWYYAEGETVHLFCLLGTGGRSEVAHLVSRDLRNWENAGYALRRGEAGSWDDLRLATGSVIRHQGTYWMAYTGHHSGDEPMVQRVGMASSADLYRWTKLPQNPVSEASASHYELMATGKRPKVHWRDPFLLPADATLGTDAGVLQLITARRKDGPVTSRGTVAVTRSRDLRNWEVLPPLRHDRIAEEMEVPQVYPIGGRWHLLFCTCSGHERIPDLLDPAFKSRFPGHRFRCTDYSMVGDSPLGPFRIHGTGEVFAEAPAPWCYASQLVNFKGEWFLLATLGDASGTMISDPYPIVADETGIHVPPDAIRTP